MLSVRIRNSPKRSNDSYFTTLSQKHCKRVYYRPSLLSPFDQAVDIINKFSFLHLLELLTDDTTQNTRVVVDPFQLQMRFELIDYMRVSPKSQGVGTTTHADDVLTTTHHLRPNFFGGASSQLCGTTAEEFLDGLLLVRTQQHFATQKTACAHRSLTGNQHSRFL
jgi:hypothetical protein